MWSAASMVVCGAQTALLAIRIAVQQRAASFWINLLKSILQKPVLMSRLFCYHVLLIKSLNRNDTGIQVKQ